jgi:hypothetical protein
VTIDIALSIRAGAGRSIGRGVLVQGVAAIASVNERPAATFDTEMCLWYSEVGDPPTPTEAPCDEVGG